MNLIIQAVITVIVFFDYSVFIDQIMDWSNDPYVSEHKCVIMV